MQYEKRYRKEFTFDLIVEQLKKSFGEKKHTKGYDELNHFFCKERGYEHRQGSVYCSKFEMSSLEVISTVDDLKKECSWLGVCLTRMDVADVGKLHELTNLINEND